MIIIYVDGSPKGRSAIVVPELGIREVVLLPDGLTNNEAEYYAVLKGLEYMNNNYPGSPLYLYSDSQLIINQILGNWRCMAHNLQPYLKCVRDFVALNQMTVEFDWVMREGNPAGSILDTILSFENQIEKEILKEEQTGIRRNYVQELFEETDI